MRHLRPGHGKVIGPLLAKSTRHVDAPEPWCTLQGHTKRTLDAADAILEQSAKPALAMFGLSVQPWLELCLAAVRIGAFGHDLGKANDQFQRMVRGDREVRQGHRHELLSYWLFAEPGPLHQWALGSVPPSVADACLCAVVGHHLKFEDGAAFAFAPNGTGTSLTFLGSHPDFARLLESGASRLDMASPPTLEESSFGAHDADLEGLCLASVQRLRARLTEAPRDYRVFVALVRSMVIAADVTASMLARRGDVDPGSWVSETLRATASSQDLESVVARRLAGHVVRPFQLAVSSSTAPVTLVRAGCGTGKTAGAYLWAARQGAGRKIFVCYPTTGTATEGFADYVRDGDLGASLIHSRAQVDLDLLVNGPEPPVEAARQWADTSSAVTMWGSAVAVVTADTVLGLLQNYRTPLFAFPALANAAFIFDEIHQYDIRMFATLCRFIEEAREAPSLLMTASLPTDRRQQLERAVQTRGRQLAVIDGPPELERGARYDIEMADGPSAVSRALALLADGGKVLWVCNTVDAAVAQARKMTGARTLPLVYHSRFRYEDRAARHRQAVDAFKRQGAALAVTTQVCEVSLDLSADLLVSHLAPVPAMIQRLGRLNRRYDPANPTTRTALFVEPPGPHPYTGAELDLGRRWLSVVARPGRSQADLTGAFEALETPSTSGSPLTLAWIDRPPFAWQAPLREGAPSIQVLLPADAPSCRRGNQVLLEEVTRRSIPMPLLRHVDREFPAWPRLAMAFIAPEGRVRYSPEFGASWTRRTGQ